MRVRVWSTLGCAKSQLLDKLYDVGGREEDYREGGGLQGGRKTGGREDWREGGGLQGGGLEGGRKTGGREGGRRTGGREGGRRTGGKVESATRLY